MTMLSSLNRTLSAYKPIKAIKEDIRIELKHAESRIYLHNTKMRMWIKEFTSEIMMKDKPSAYSKALKDTMKSATVAIDEYIENEEKKCNGVLASYVYCMMIESTLTKEDEDIIKSISSGVDEFFEQYGDVNFAFKGIVNIEALITRIEWLGKEIMQFGLYDTENCVNLFADSLIHMGKYVEKNGHTINHVKKGKQAQRAGGMLKSAYEYRVDKSASNIYDKMNTYFEPCKDKPGLTEWKHTWESKHPDRLEKMLKIANKRQYKQDMDLKEDAWNYITNMGGNSELFKFPRLDGWSD